MNRHRKKDKNKGEKRKIQTATVSFQVSYQPAAHEPAPQDWKCAQIYTVYQISQSFEV